MAAGQPAPDPEQQRHGGVQQPPGTAPRPAPVEKQDGAGAGRDQLGRAGHHVEATEALRLPGRWSEGQPRGAADEPQTNHHDAQEPHPSHQTARGPAQEHEGEGQLRHHQHAEEHAVKHRLPEMLPNDRCVDQPGPGGRSRRHPSPGRDPRYRLISAGEFRPRRPIAQVPGPPLLHPHKHGEKGGRSAENHEMDFMAGERSRRSHSGLNRPSPSAN